MKLMEKKKHMRNISFAYLLFDFIVTGIMFL